MNNQINNKSIAEKLTQEDIILKEQYERESTAGIRIAHIKKYVTLEYQPDHKFYIEVMISNERKVFIATSEDLSSLESFNKCLIKRVALPASLFFKGSKETSRTRRFSDWLFNALVRQYPEIINSTPATVNN